MQIVYRRLKNNTHQYYNRKLQKHYNFHIYPKSKQTYHDLKGKKISANSIGGNITKGKQSKNPLRKTIV